MFLWTNKNINNFWLKKCLIWGYAILLEFGMEFLSRKRRKGHSLIRGFTSRFYSIRTNDEDFIQTTYLHHSAR